MTMETIYVLVEGSGEYSERTQTPVGWFSTLDAVHAELARVAPIQRAWGDLTKRHAAEEEKADLTADERLRMGHRHLEDRRAFWAQRHAAKQRLEDYEIWTVERHPND